MSDDVRYMRSAGLLEKLHISRHALGFDSGVIVAARYVSASGERLNRDNLFPALRAVISQHAALSTGISGETEREPVFYRLSQISLPQVVTFSDDDESSLAAVMESQFCLPFDTASTKPLWRLTVLKDNTLVLCFHHGLCDGLSLLAFHCGLLRALQARHSADAGDVVDICDTCNLEPPIEAVTDLTPSFWKVLRTLYGHYAPTSWTRPSTAWTGNHVPDKRTLETRVVIFDISPADSKHFVELCRAHSATVTSALHVLAVAALSQLVPNAKSKCVYKSISAYVPVSLRGPAGTSPDAMCDHVTAFHSYPSLAPAFSWATASALASTLRKQPLEARQEIGMLNYVSDYAGFFESQLGSKRSAGLEISNLGAFHVEDALDTDGSEKWGIERTVFAQCANAFGAALLVSAVGAPNGGLTISVDWGPTAVGDAFARAFLDKFQEGLRELLVLP